MHQGARDLHHLGVSARQRAHGRIDVESRVEPHECGGCLPAHRCPVESAEARTRANPPHEQVLDDGQVGEEVEFLRHHGNARRLGDTWRRQGDDPSGDFHVALVGQVDAVQHLHKRALAGPVLAHDRVDLAGSNLQVDAPTRPDAAEPFASAHKPTGVRDSRLCRRASAAVLVDGWRHRGSQTAARLARALVAN